MGWTLFKVLDGDKERFLVWSSIVDAPITFACSEKEITTFFVEDAKERAEAQAKEMIARAHERSTSSRLGETLDDVALANRAGPDESSLTKDEIIEFFVRRKIDPTEELLAAYRRKVK